MNQQSDHRDTKKNTNTNTETQISLDGLFYEIEYDTTPMKGVGKYVLKSQPIQAESKEDPKKAEIRELFHKMRDLARHNFTPMANYSRFFDQRVRQDNSAVFYQQAIFMKDFEDDYSEQVPFSAYFPYYQMMGYEQLRSYFTWRSKVRKGIIEATSLSYVFLYLYELLNQIGVDHPEDGLFRILTFWSKYRFFDGTIDRYLPRWITDYHIYYDVPNLYEEFLHENKLKKSYPVILDHARSFDLYCFVSKYNITKSIFYLDANKKMIEECFLFLLDRIRKVFQDAGIPFDETVYTPTRKLVPWKPFKDALFFAAFRQPDRRVVLSENDIYLCKNNVWSYSTVIASDIGRQFIAYVMKQMEAELRKITKFKTKIKVTSDMLPTELRNLLNQGGIDLEDLIASGVQEFYREVTKTVVSVDHEALHRIRQEALSTQEALLVEEEVKQVPRIEAKSEVLIKKASGASLASFQTEQKPSDPWQEFKAALTETELQAILHLLHGGSMKAFADERKMMVEVLADSVNEKAFDLIGDNIVDEEHEIYEDYIEKCKGMVG